MKKLLLIFLCIPLMGLGQDYNELKDCSSACDCADKLVVIAEDIREIEKRLWEKNLTKEEEREIELESIKFWENLGEKYLFRMFEIIEKYSSKMNDCESIKNMKGTITQTGTDDKYGNSTLYYYDGYVKEDNSGNRTYFLYDGTIITRIKK